MFPADLRYTKDHEWVRREADGTFTIGITDFAQGELGDIVFVDVNTVGESVEAEAVFGTVEAVKTVSELFMPVSGEVLEVNAGLDANPEAVNNDPYGAGWMIRVRPSDPASFETLLTADEYRDLVS